MNPSSVSPIVFMPAFDCSRSSAITRRQFVKAAGAAVAAPLLGPALEAASAAASKTPLFAAIGITAPINRAAELKAVGADYLAPTVAGFLMPDQSDAEFAKVRSRLEAATLPVLGCNSFLRHPRLRCTGPDAAHDTVLAFCDVAFRRLSEVGGKFIGFGSNTSRQIPEDWPKERADEQFVALLRRMGPLAARYGITIAVEQQRQAEVNYLNFMCEVLHVVRAADHPNIRVLADLYHMPVVGDTPADLAAAMPWVGLVELAEPARRTLPGVDGYDFRPWFAELARGGYHGYINIEGDGTPEQLREAFATVRSQAAAV
jgi:sugar phosphate isomerase/epimerase